MNNYRYITSFSIALLVIAILTNQPVFADDKTQNNVRTVSMTLSPADAPTPAMKYRLTVPLGQTRRDNAALDYYNAVMSAEILTTEDNENINKWLKTPYEELPHEEIQGLLRNLNLAFSFLESGVTCRDCQWQIPIEQGFSAIMPRLYEQKRLAQCLALKARMEIYEGNFDSTLKTMQTGITNARHIGNDVTIIQSLVGIVITSFMLNEVETLIQQPDAPNLYWALTMLPDPMFDLSQPMEFEYSVFEYQWPLLKELNQRVFSPEEIRCLENSIISDLDNVGSPPEKVKKNAEEEKRIYSLVKDYLRKKGKTLQEIDAMPAQQTVLLYHYYKFQETRDQMFCWHYVPYAQAVGQTRYAEKARQQDYEFTRNPLLRSLPDLLRVHYLNTRLERQIAALRCVEAIRMSAARMNGKLPSSLEAITDVPLPVDPVTGRPFIYRVDGNKATLESFPADEEDSEKVLRYEITLR